MTAIKTVLLTMLTALAATCFSCKGPATPPTSQPSAATTPANQAGLIRQYSQQYRAHKDRKSIQWLAKNALKIGMESKEVEALLGRPGGGPPGCLDDASKTGDFQYMYDGSEFLEITYKDNKIVEIGWGGFSHHE